MERERVKNAEKPGRPGYVRLEHDYVGRRKVLSNSQARAITYGQYDFDEYS
jgi:hypothetical protein